MANSLGTTTALSGNANSLANGSYASLGVIDFTTAPPGECLLELTLQAASTPAAPFQVLVFLRTSLNGTDFGDAPASATQQNAEYIGKVAIENTSAHRSKVFSLSSHFGGALPQKGEVFVYNNTGVALAATGQTGQYRFEIFG